MIYIKVGYELIYDCPQPTPMLLMLNIHYSHANEIVIPDSLVVSPPVVGSRLIAMASATGAIDSRRPRDERRSAPPPSCARTE